MTGSLDEVRATLYAVLELLTSAQQHAGAARTNIDDAVGVLSVLGEKHSEPLPPPELVRAVERLQDGLGLIGSGAQLVADIGARI
ncbi:MULTISPECIES: hypothetical protein [unclassified Pseudonocardia]|uniref:hypothetical protein n=1 Tax=unclassified Pseudonocardia TaxID=2619320 RepID=UPI000958FCAE|nr:MULTISPECIES: hypothetical protein [unclassified Pseudonocardia]MBN9097275.1 hypothetical protein [Pseudonocardia sp.]OJY48847.1 MAG: hypothetical protein BGP03_08600 [Pseudonocardia sp. 73-21]